MNVKISVFAICVKAIDHCYITCYYIICRTVPLIINPDTKEAATWGVL